MVRGRGKYIIKAKNTIYAILVNFLFKSVHSISLIWSFQFMESISKQLINERICRNYFVFGIDSIRSINYKVTRKNFPHEL